MNEKTVEASFVHITNPSKHRFLFREKNLNSDLKLADQQTQANNDFCTMKKSLNSDLKFY
jgi:hypothetical protein